MSDPKTNQVEIDIQPCPWCGVARWVAVPGQPEGRPTRCGLCEKPAIVVDGRLVRHELEIHTNSA